MSAAETSTSHGVLLRFGCLRTRDRGRAVAGAHDGRHFLLLDQPLCLADRDILFALIVAVDEFDRSAVKRLDAAGLVDVLDREVIAAPDILAGECELSAQRQHDTEADLSGFGPRARYYERTRFGQDRSRKGNGACAAQEAPSCRRQILHKALRPVLVRLAHCSLSLKVLGG